MDALRKKVALITGASSGIGREFALRFARLGYDLIVTGRRMEKLQELARKLKLEFGTRVITVTAELSEDKDVALLVEMIRQRKDIYVLINNAGYGSGLEFLPYNINDHLRMVKVHVIASLKLTHAVLPQMVNRLQGTVINVSSLGAFTPARGSSMYAATKMFLKSFSESLFIELGRYGINIQCLCPGFTNTEFHSRRHAGSEILKSKNFLWMDAGSVADKSMRALQKGAVLFIPGILNKLIAIMATLMPRRLYCRIMRPSGNFNVVSRALNVGNQPVEKPVSLFFSA